MTDYSRQVASFTAKDSLPTGDPDKLILGADFDSEFNALVTTIATKADLASPVLTGTPTAPTAGLGTDTTQIATTAYVQNEFDNNLTASITATAAEINILDGATVTTAEVNILDGVTSTTAELNILDGVTATTAELNYVSGVGSAIQDQLDTKAPTASPTFTGTVTIPTLTVNTTLNMPAGSVDTDELASFSVTSAKIDANAVDSTKIANDAVTSTKIDTNAVDQTALAADSVGQSEVKTTYQSVSGTTSEQDVAATGGAYCLGLSAQYNGSWVQGGGGSSGGSTYVFQYHQEADGSPLYRSMRGYYINASPPYDMGDGDIPLFAYATIDNTTGNIDGLSVSPDPIWIYNGPTDCTPSRYQRQPDGSMKKFRKRKDMSGHGLTKAQAQAAGATAYREYMEAFKNAEWVEEELTNEIIHADMNIIPHPFIGNDLTGKTVVMLDPMSPVLRTLLEMREYDDFDDEIEILRNFVTVGNSPLNRVGPQGLMIPSLGWKNT